MKRRSSTAMNSTTATKSWAILCIPLLLAMGQSAVRAQDEMPAAMDGMSQTQMPGMGHGTMPALDEMNMKGMIKETTSSPRRDPHAYSDGYDFGPVPRPRMGDEMNFASLMMDRLEWVRSSDTTATAYDLQAWYGRDYDRAVIKAEGDIDGGKLQEARSELLWGHAVAPYWDTQLGVRYDSGVDPGRAWLAFAVQGMAPYWFEIDSAVYVSDAGHSALRLSADYELLFSQKLILQPRVEANFYGKSDAARELGAGLSDLTAGLRLRYEIRREFAPYIGVEWVGSYGGTADYLRRGGAATDEMRFVAGLRFWF